MAEPVFRVEGTNGAMFAVTVHRRAHSNACDYWDGNWLDATIAISARSFRGEINAQLRADDFARFRHELHTLNEKLVGHAKHEALEGWLAIDIEGDGKGHMRANCVAIDEPGSGNRLAFTLDFDQTDLPPILSGLSGICEAFPVLGRP